jgi:hypothetical protein
MELPYTAEWFTAAAIINKYLIVGWLDPSEDQHPCPFDKAFNVHTLPAIPVTSLQHISSLPLRLSDVSHTT